MANKYTNRNLIDFKYQASDEVNLAKQAKENAENAVKNYGPFSYSKQGDYDNVMDSILNRKKFSYDLNGDALYQQYKDLYKNQGRLASADVIGQASAMTGGYGNSYAATVGNQAYQSYLQNLNNIVPELYQLAMDRYNLEGEQLNNKYNLLATDRANALEEHEMGYNKLLTERDYTSNEYNAAYNRDYNSQKDYADTNNTNYWNEYNANYTAEQDAKNYALQARQVAAAESSARSAAQQAAYTLSKSQESEYMELISSKDWDSAAAYIDKLVGKGLSEQQAGYWLSLIPESYFNKKSVMQKLKDLLPF